jgi:L-lactate dehydrogenase (cytochrome)
VPPRFDLRTLASIAVRPVWALNTLAAGVPKFETVMPYVESSTGLRQASKFLASLIEGHVDAEMLERIRARWKGRLVVKGVLSVEDALACKAMGIDGIVVSNHGGRQLDAAPASIEVLGAVKAAVGDGMAVMADGGVRCGLDVARMLACGADFVLMGRAFMFAMAAVGARGAEHAMGVFKEELRSTMAQLGCADIAGLPGFRVADAEVS